MRTEQKDAILKPSLAILDWGIGGMDFYRILKECYPKTGVCYFSDAGDVPYGKQKKEQLIERLRQIVVFLKQRNVTHLVVACNAMSTVLPEVLSGQAVKDFKITGVIEPAVAAVIGQKGEYVGVVGGRRTVLSGAYGKPLRQHFKAVTQRVAQPLSAMIERGEKETLLFRETLGHIMSPLKNTDILILACTHYPAAQDSFKALAPHAEFVNPSAETFKWVERNWHFEKNDAPDVFYTTGEPEAMRSASDIAFGVKLGHITAISREL